jgi:hypothetical protein
MYLRDNRAAKARAAVCLLDHYDLLQSQNAKSSSVAEPLGRTGQ